MGPTVKSTGAPYAPVPTNDACKSVAREQTQDGPRRVPEPTEAPLNPELVKRLLDQLDELETDAAETNIGQHDEWDSLGDWAGYWWVLSHHLSTPTFDKTAVDGKLRCKPTPLFNAVHRTMAMFAFIWLFFGKDGRGIFNKLGCSVNWTDVAANAGRHLGFDSSRSDIEVSTAGCSGNDYSGFWPLVDHLSTFGMLVFTGSMAFAVLRKTTQSVRLEVIAELQGLGFEKRDILTRMHRNKGSTERAIAELLIPDLKKLLVESRQEACDIDHDRIEQHQPDLANILHTSDCACQVCSILRTAAYDISPLRWLELGQPFTADPATLPLDREAKADPSLRIKTALSSAIKEHCDDILGHRSPRSIEMELTEDGALQVLFEQLFAASDDDILVKKAKDRFKARAWIGVPITAFLTFYRVCSGISAFCNSSGENHELEPYLLLVQNLALALCDSTLGYWWVLLQLAVEMTRVQIERVTKQIKFVRDRVSADEHSEKWEEEWEHSIEKPALRLVRRILPALNDGFGSSWICIVAALTLHVVSLVHEFVAVEEAFWSQPDRSWEMYRKVPLTSFLTVLPALLTWSAARISSECDGLMRSLTELCHRSNRKSNYYGGSWRKEQALIEPLHNALAQANENHGPGFMIPMVHAKLSFKTLLSFMTALVVFLIEGLPHLIDESPENDYRVGSDVGCPFNWHSVEGKCLRLFGADGSELHTWNGAEEFCQQYGGHLMSIETHEQQLAAAAIVTASPIPQTQGVWIGLTRDRHSGTMQWIDNSSMKYHHWAIDEPDSSADGDDKCVDDSLPAHQGFTVNTTRDDCGILSESSGFKWWDTPCTKTSFKPRIKASSTAVDECYHAYYPFICSKPALPESPSGGHMNGCLHGRWVLGVAHGDSALPATVVPSFGNDDDSLGITMHAPKERIEGSVYSAAECMSRVLMKFPETASGAE